MSWTMVVVLLGVAVLVIVMVRKGGVKPQVILDARDRGAKVVDVRSPGEFAGGHVSGAVNVPVEKIVASPASVGPVGKPVIVYCQSGMRSARAAGVLRTAGYEVIDAGSFAKARAALG